MQRPPVLDKLAADDPAKLPGQASSKELVEDLLAMLVDPSWAFRQYDHQLFRNTVVAPGADAAVLRLSAPGARRPRGPPPARSRSPPTGTPAGALSTRVRAAAS